MHTIKSIGLAITMPIPIPKTRKIFFTKSPKKPLNFDCIILKSEMIYKNTQSEIITRSIVFHILGQIGLKFVCPYQTTQEIGRYLGLS